MATKLLCYACSATFDRTTPPRHSASGERLCPSCGSDFIEELDDGPAEGQPPPPGQPQPGAGRPHFFSAGPSMFGLHVAGLHVAGGEGYPQMMLGPAGEQLLEALREQFMEGGSLNGARVVLQYGGPEPMRPGQAGGPPGGRAFQIGDFAFGNLDHILEQLMEAHQPTFLPTQRSTIDSLPRRTIPRPGSPASPGPASVCKAGEPCTVCHDDFQAGAEVIELPCQHGFHEGCIVPWLETHNTCPVCRAELPAGEPARAADAAMGAGAGAGAGASGGEGTGAAAALPTMMRALPHLMEEWLQHAQGAFSVELQRLEHEQEEHLRQHSRAHLSSWQSGSGPASGSAPPRPGAAVPSDADGSWRTYDGSGNDDNNAGSGLEEGSEGPNVSDSIPGLEHARLGSEVLSHESNEDASSQSPDNSEDDARSFAAGSDFGSMSGLVDVESDSQPELSVYTLLAEDNPLGGVAVPRAQRTPRAAAHAVHDAETAADLGRGISTQRPPKRQRTSEEQARGPHVEDPGKCGKAGQHGDAEDGGESRRGGGALGFVTRPLGWAVRGALGFVSRLAGRGQH